MAGGRQHNLLDHLRSSFLSCTSPDASDGRLLERFLIDRDQPAFAALVRRHGAMVLGVCRRVLRDHHLAEDAFQATFMVLVRKAAGLRRRQTLGNWLYGVAYHTALKARSVLVRHRSKEQQARMLYPKPSMPDPEPRDWLPLLDQELSGLPDRYRQAIVLCDLEGKSRKEAARLLGWREGTLSGRLARGRMLLARRLARRGVILSGGALALTVATHTAVAVPHPLLVLTTQAAAHVAAGPLAAAGALSPPVASLIEGVLRAMIVSKLKIAALVLTVTAASAGLGIFRPGLAAGTAAGDRNQPSQAKTLIARVEAPARQERDVEAKLKTVVSLRFKDAPLRQVLEDLRSATGLNIVLDRPGLRASGISEEQPLSLQVDGVTLKTALQHLLRDAQLQFHVQEGVLLITPDPPQAMRVYPVGDLIVGTDKKTGEEQLIHLVTTVVAPRTWSSMGGNGNIDFYPLGMSLAVNQNPAVHEQLAALLEGLRAFKAKK